MHLATAPQFIQSKKALLDPLPLKVTLPLSQMSSDWLPLECATFEQEVGGASVCLR